jgi:hypothetical protein
LDVKVADTTLFWGRMYQNDNKGAGDGVRSAKECFLPELSAKGYAPETVNLRNMRERLRHPHGGPRRLR